MIESPNLYGPCALGGWRGGGVGNERSLSVAKAY